jgi:hypothetical protein
MFKLAAAIRNHFVVVPYFEAKALCSISPRRILAPTMQGAGIPRRFPSIVVPKLLAALFPDPAWASLACKAPAVCSQLQRMGR